MPSLRFDPALVESIVTAAAARDASVARAYRDGANPLYETVPADEREPAFDRLHARLFAGTDTGEMFAALFAESPILPQRAPSLLVLDARLGHEEGAVIGRDGRSVCLRIAHTRFADTPRLQAYVRHELLHAADMLDEAFGYRIEDAARLSAGGAAHALADRYRALWCASVDARLAQRNVDPLMMPEAHRRVFEQCFGAPGAATFEQVWNAAAWTHSALLTLAVAAAHPGRASGGRCPLCGFRTHDWAQEIAAETAALIRADFPAWQAGDGACGRCAERYQMLAQSA